MKLRLPDQVFEDQAMRQGRIHTAVLLAAGLSLLLSGWQLFGLPGAPIAKVEAPRDLPWYGFGFQGGFIEPDGTWVLNRDGYADRKKRYVIKPGGSLEASRESGIFQGDDISGSYRGAGVLMARRSALRVKSAPGYYEWMSQQRDLAVTNKRAARPRAADPPVERSAAHFADNADRAQAEFGPMSVIVSITTANDVLAFPVLSHESYFSVFDSACFTDPNLWITTGHLKALHRIHASDAADRPAVKELATVKLDIPAAPDFDSLLLHDPLLKRLALLLPDGRRYWFDPESLELLGQDKLPGRWEREYASFGSTLGRYGLRTGFGMTEAQYKLAMRSLMLVFLASLLWLAWQWRAPWKYTLAATTADSSSSNRSPPT